MILQCPVSNDLCTGRVTFLMLTNGTILTFLQDLAADKVDKMRGTIAQVTFIIEFCYANDKSLLTWQEQHYVQRIDCKSIIFTNFAPTLLYKVYSCLEIHATYMHGKRRGRVQ